MQKISWIILLALLSSKNPLCAEIDQIEIRWNEKKCLNICIPGIERSLQQMKQIENIRINGETGTAVMNWNSDQPFNFEPFRLASASAGIRFDEVHLRVTGTISRSGDNFFLTSSRDNTRFLLDGPNPTHFTRRSRILRSVAPLSNEVKNQLSEAERQRAVVEISGPLFRPNEPVLRLIVEQLQTKLQ